MKNSFYHIILIGITVLCSVGCASIKMRTADNFYNDLAYYDALHNYEQVAISKQYPKAIIRTAECYRLLNFNKEAEQWYALAMEDENIEPVHHFEYAKVLMKNGNYSKAKRYLNKYLITDRNNIYIKELINSCDSLTYFFYRDTTMYDIESLEWNGLNSSNFSPRYYKSGIMFVSDRDHPLRISNRNPYTGKNTYDIFFVKLTEFGNWLQPEPIFGNVNGIFNEGPFALTTSGDTMYVTRNNYVDDKPVKNQDNLSTLKIYRAIFSSAEWKIDSELGINSEDYSVAHPTISKNGKYMVFMSDMPWGYGGTDLYWSQKVNDQWTTPKNLGQIVNTSENELFPYLQNDSILYFSSNANHNMGGLDIFYSIRSKGVWSEPVNLGFPVNTSMDDFGYVIDKEGKAGYFNSNRNGADMIYSFTKGLAKINVAVTLVDSETKGNIRNAPVSIFTDNTKVGTEYSNNAGTVSFVLQPDKNYKISTGNNSFYYNEIDVSTVGIRESNTKYFKLNLDQILLHQPQVYNDIKFELKSASFLNGSESKVEDLAKKLKNNATLRVEIISHTSSVGSRNKNSTLTSQRANKIKNILVSHGIDSGRISTRGLGESLLINHCKDGILCLEEEHAENDRIEIKVVGFMP